MLSAVAIGFRAVQIIVAVVVLGISVDFMKAQKTGSSPVTTRYSVFAGAFGIIVAIIGLASHWLESIPTQLPIAVDLLSALFFLAGGIAWAVGMKGASCTESSIKSLYNNVLLNQGCLSDGVGDIYADGPYCYVAGQQTKASWPLTNLWPSPLKNLCQKAYANESFQFIGFAAAIILVILGFLLLKRRGGKLRFVA